MNVLFYPRRRALEQRGGDLLALQETIRALEALDIRATISTDPSLDLTPFEFVHLYSLGDPFSALEFAFNALRQNKPLVTTPIYWRRDQWLDARINPQPNHPEHSLDALTPEEYARVKRVFQLEHDIFRGAHQLILNLAARVFVLSHAEGQILHDEFGVPFEKLAVTPNGVNPAYAHGDAERFLRTHSIPTRDFVLCVARVEERKNSLGVIRAWRSERVPLVFVGRVPDAAYFEMCRAAADTHVYFCGALPPEQVADACAAARVHVMASWWEEQGMAALEAGIAGCNLVMTQNSPGREYFGSACFMCDPGDESSIHDAICTALEAPRDDALPSRIRENFTWERAAQTLASEYRAVAPITRSLDGAALLQLTNQLMEMWQIKRARYQELQDAAQRQDIWIKELEHIAARRRERLYTLPLIGPIATWLNTRP